MRNQPNRNYASEDRVMTPPGLALACMRKLNPWGRYVEPCAGEGAFVQAAHTIGIDDVESWEIDRGHDFMKREPRHNRADWIVTNPPWSKINSFLYASMRNAHNVAFLMTLNHAFTKARVRDADELGFEMRGLYRVDRWPEGWPKSGFQLGLVWWSDESWGNRIEQGKVEW